MKNNLQNQSSKSRVKTISTSIAIVAGLAAILTWLGIGPFSHAQNQPMELVATSGNNSPVFKNSGSISGNINVGNGTQINGNNTVINPLPTTTPQAKIETTSQSGGANAIEGNASSSDSHNQTDSHNQGPTTNGNNSSITDTTSDNHSINQSVSGNISAPVIQQANSPNSPISIVSPAQRALSSEQKINFLVLLKDVPKGSVFLDIGVADNESRRFAYELKDLLSQAGFNTGSIVGEGFGGKPYPPGLALLITDANNPPLFAGKLQQAFDQIGIKVPDFVEPSVEAGTVKLIVGSQ